MSEPPITLRARYDSGPGNLIPTRVVVHATCPGLNYPNASAPGTAHSTAVYFTTATAGGSAHYVCGVDTEEHCVPDAVTAWHAPPNLHSIGIEITADGGDNPSDYTRDQWLSPLVWPAVQRAAARTAELCARFSIPAVRLSVADLLAGKHGICGHVDVSQAWRQSTHTDPGPNFPWPEFMAAVTGPQTTPSPAQEDVMSPIELTFYNDTWQPDPAGLNFRGASPAESGPGSAVIDTMWVRWVAYWGICTWKIVAWDSAKPIAQAPSGGDWWQLPATARGFTVEGRRNDPGVQPAATVLVKTK